MNKAILNSAMITLMMSIASACSPQVATSSSDTRPEPSAANKSAVENTQENASGESHKSHSENSAASITRSADSHSHGDAELALVLEDDTLTIELDTPLFNVLGFERHPETALQKAKTETVENQLGNVQELFTFNAEAGCVLISGRKDITLFQDAHDDHDDHDESQDHAATHKDILLQYQYQCAKPSSLTSLTVNLFEFFPDMSDIDVTYLGPSTQKQVSLTRENTQVNLSR